MQATITHAKEPCGWLQSGTFNVIMKFKITNYERGMFMKKKLCKLMLGITATAFLLAACGDKETTAPTEDASIEEDASEEDAPEEELSEASDEDTENPDDSDDSMTEEEFNELMAQWDETGEIPEGFGFSSFPEPTCPYIGLTIPEILDEGFYIYGYESMSGGSIYQITVMMQKDYACLTVNLNVDSETCDAFFELTDSDEKNAFISDHFSEEKMTASNCDYSYQIYTKSQLEACAADGNCTRETSMEGKTYSELMAEGYQKSAMVSSMNNEFFIKFCDENYQQGYIIMLDLSEKGEDVDIFGFWDEVEPRLSDYTVMAAYAIK